MSTTRSVPLSPRNTTNKGWPILRVAPGAASAARASRRRVAGGSGGCSRGAPHSLRRSDMGRAPSSSSHACTREVRPSASNPGGSACTSRPSGCAGPVPLNRAFLRQYQEPGEPGDPWHRPRSRDTCLGLRGGPQRALEHRAGGGDACVAGARVAGNELELPALERTVGKHPVEHGRDLLGRRAPGEAEKVVRLPKVRDPERSRKNKKCRHSLASVTCREERGGREQ